MRHLWESFARRLSFRRAESPRRATYVPQRDGVLTRGLR